MAVASVASGYGRMAKQRYLYRVCLAEYLGAYRSTRVLFFCEGVYFFERYRKCRWVRRAARYFLVDPRRVRAVWARTGEIFPVYTSLTYKFGTSWYSKSSTGSNLRYTRCLDLKYPVRTGTADPRFTGFTGFTRYEYGTKIPNLRPRGEALIARYRCTKFSMRSENLPAYRTGRTQIYTWIYPDLYMHGSSCCTATAAVCRSCMRAPDAGLIR